MVIPPMAIANQSPCGRLGHNSMAARPAGPQLKVSNYDRQGVAAKRPVWESDLNCHLLQPVAETPPSRGHVVHIARGSAPTLPCQLALTQLDRDLDTVETVPTSSGTRPQTRWSTPRLVCKNIGPGATTMCFSQGERQSFWHAGLAPKIQMNYGS